jgi:hypothetical protein
MTLLLLLAFFVLLPAAVALLTETSILRRAFSRPAFRIGAAVVYRQAEVAACPALGARDIHPAERGEYYYYSILNYLRVSEVLGDGRIIAVGRHNERLCFWPNDSCLRKARLTERLVHNLRFPRS